MKKKNTFKESSYHERFNSFHNAIRFIGDNTMGDTSNTIEISPTEKLKIESELRYSELKRMVNTPPDKKAAGKLSSFYHKQRHTILSYLLSLGYVVYAAGFFTLIYYLFK